MVWQDSLEGLHMRKVMEARQLIKKMDKGSLESLLMVDTLKRLSIDYHFEDETRSILREHHLISISDGHPGNNSTLSEITLRFRLLHQEGYYVPADIFKKFKVKGYSKGGYVFDTKLSNDVFGLLSLYEASHLGIPGEDILDEAADFTKSILSRFPSPFQRIDHGTIYEDMSSQTLEELTNMKLANPFHKSLPPYTPKCLLLNPRGPFGKRLNALRDLAIMDSHVVKSINQAQIKQISRWWKDLGIEEEFKFARDQPTKWYMWSMAILSDPALSEGRVDLTKAIAMIYIVDDIFDVYGSLDELTLFTEAVKRWECMDDLPDYMKTCFRTLDKVTNEISFETYRRHNWDPTDILRKSWASLCDAFLMEARLFSSGHVASSEDYLKNAIISSGVHIVIVHSFASLSDGVNEQTLDLLNKFPAIFTSAATILRLWDDLGSAKDEDQEGHHGSYMDYYMKEIPGCTLERARDHVNKMISNSWKDLNREWLFPGPFSPSLARVSLNTARMVPLMYGFDENHRLLRLQELMKSMLDIWLVKDRFQLPRYIFLRKEIATTDTTMGNMPLEKIGG